MPIGWFATKLRVASLPREVYWTIMLGGGCLAGIGFTMSIFIGSLALEGDLLDEGKIGTLAGSAISAILGCALLLMFLKSGRSQSQIVRNDTLAICLHSRQSRHRALV